MEPKDPDPMLNIDMQILGLIGKAKELASIPRPELIKWGIRKGVAAIKHLREQQIDECKDCKDCKCQKEHSH